MTIINMDTEHDKILRVFLQSVAPNFEQNVSNFFLSSFANSSCTILSIAPVQ